MSDHPHIVFVCEHGAAKSVIAAAYFNKLSSESGLQIQAVARGTNPDSELSAIAIAGLRDDSFTPTESVPQKLSLKDVESAQRIVSFCELPEPEEYHKKPFVERWDDVPPVSENYEKARDAILERINELLNRI
jgi:arsenate reductase (thioredoxin)